MAGGLLTSFPLRLLRQQDEPIDADTTFETTADRIAYLTSPRRYAGIPVFDKEDGNMYFLHKDKDAWVPFSTGASGNIVFETDTNGFIEIPLKTLIHGFVVESNQDLVGFTIGTDAVTPNIAPGWLNLTAGEPEFFGYAKPCKTAKQFYIGGLDTNTATVTITVICEKYQ